MVVLVTMLAGQWQMREFESQVMKKQLLTLHKQHLAKRSNDCNELNPRTVDYITTAHWKSGHLRFVDGENATFCK